jgi:cobalt-zinc-cadmium efflux system outer membrane protein
MNAYRLGEVDLLNLIQAQQIYLNSQQRYLSALRDYYIQLVELERFLNLELVY